MWFNYALEAAILANLLAQIVKVPIRVLTKKEWSPRLLISTGGMPSSHSAVVTSLATLIGKNIGVGTPMFAMALIFAFVVMYDAAGVRRAAGKQARLLNKIVETPGLSGLEVSERLVEVLGHTPLQVVVGAVIGVVAGLIF